MCALEFADFVNIASISCEVIGFIFLLPRIKNWLERKNEYRPRDLEIFDFLKDMRNEKFEHYKSRFEKTVKWSLDDKEYQKFISYFKDVHSMEQKYPYKELRENEDYRIRWKYVFETIKKEEIEREFKRKQPKYENLGIFLVIVGLVGQGISTLLQT